MVGEQVRSRRKAAGLTQAEVGRRCGITIAQISLIENGRVDARMSTIIRILNVTGGTLADLSLDPPRAMALDDLLERRASNALRLAKTGLKPSDPTLRIARKQNLGIDVSAEQAALM